MPFVLLAMGILNGIGRSKIWKQTVQDVDEWDQKRQEARESKRQGEWEHRYNTMKEQEASSQREEATKQRKEAAEQRRQHRIDSQREQHPDMRWPTSQERAQFEAFLKKSKER